MLLYKSISSTAHMCNLVLTALCVVLQVALGFFILEAEGHESAAPEQVHFYSVNLRNVIRWTPGKGATRDTTYTVEYAIYGDTEEAVDSVQVAWRPVEKCCDITNTECDVTEQTDDVEEEYYARVRASGAKASSSWIETSSRFKPMMDTILGPPEVEARLININYITVKMKGPFTLRRGGKRQSLKKMIPFIVYNVTVLNNRTKRMNEHYPLENDSLLIGPLEYETEYCLIVEALSMTLPHKNMHTSWICNTTPKDPFTQMILVLLLGVVIPTALFVFILAAVGGLVYYYICVHKEKLPKSTDLIHIGENRQMFQPENLTIINLNFKSTNLSTEESKPSLLNIFKQDIKDVTDLPPALLPAEERVISSYAEQNFHLEQPLLLDPEIQEPLADDYGFVQQEEKSIVNECVPYMVQTAIKENAVEIFEEQMEKEEEQEEETQTFLNWDPETRMLKIPLMDCFDSEDIDKTEVEPEPQVDVSLLLPRSILPSVMVRQSSEESTEEDIFTKMEKVWGLQVQSTA